MLNFYFNENAARKKIELHLQNWSESIRSLTKLTYNSRYHARIKQFNDSFYDFPGSRDDF